MFLYLKGHPAQHLARPHSHCQLVGREPTAWVLEEDKGNKDSSWSAEPVPTRPALPPTPQSQARWSSWGLGDSGPLCSWSSDSYKPSIKLKDPHLNSNRKGARRQGASLGLPSLPPLLAARKPEVVPTRVASLHKARHTEVGGSSLETQDACTWRLSQGPP